MSDTKEFKEKIIKTEAGLNGPLIDMAVRMPGRVVR